MRSFTSYSQHYCSLYRLDPDALPFFKASKLARANKNKEKGVSVRAKANAGFVP